MARIPKDKYDTQSDWETKITRAKKVRENWKKVFHVDKARQYLDGKQNPGVDAADWITINNVYAHLKAQLPALYAADPYFYVKLKRSFNPHPQMIALWEKRGKIRQSMLNYLKEELDLKHKVRMSIQDAFFAYGVIKTHYYAEEVENPAAGEPIVGDDDTPMIDDEGEPLYQPDILPKNERYCITRVHPDDFLWDEDSGPLPEEWTWVAQRIREPWEDAEKNPRYNKSALRKLVQKGEEPHGDEEKEREQRKKGGDITGKTERRKRKKQNEKKPEMLVAWEIYHLRKKTYLIIAEHGEIPLMDERPVPKGVETHPYSILIFTPRDDSPYPIPPISQGMPAADEYNKARSDIQKHRKRFNRKYSVLNQAFADDDSELSKLESGDDGTIIRVNTENAISPIQDAQLDQMRYQELAYLKAEMYELFGSSSPESLGIADSESATQAGILDKRLEIKEGDALSMVMDFVKSIARKIDQLVQTHITSEEAVRVSGPQGEFWELVKPGDYEDIEGEYEYSVNIGATLPRMPHVERASWLAFLGLLANFPQLLLSRRLFQKMAEMHHIEDEAMLEEVYNIGKQMMSGALPMPGGQGSQPGVGEDRPVSAAGGRQGGGRSLEQPGAGNLSE